MKIENLKIKNNNGVELRNVSFDSSGVSIVYANIERQDDLEETINSIGKTLFLKFIDFLLGCKQSPEYFKSEINDYVIEGTLIDENNNRYSVSRKVNDPCENYINGEKYKLTEYKEELNIRRDLLDKQVYLEEKNSLISARQTQAENDYLSFLELLNLDDLLENTKKIYDCQDKIKSLNKRWKEVEGKYQAEHSQTSLEKDIYFTEKK